MISGSTSLRYDTIFAHLYTMYDQQMFFDHFRYIIDLLGIVLKNTIYTLLSMFLRFTSPRYDSKLENVLLNDSFCVSFHVLLIDGRSLILKSEGK